MSSFSTTLWNNKKTVLTVLITLCLAYAAFTVFKRADAANADRELTNRERKALQRNVTKLGKEKDSLLLANEHLWKRIKSNDSAVAHLKKSIAGKEVIVIRQQTNIKTIKDKYETVYRLDSVSDDELVRLFSEHNIETSPDKKR